MFQLILLGIALSLDTFSICVPAGIITKKINWFNILRIALIFAIFHIVMISIGWGIGTIVISYIWGYDHWITSGILVAVGLRTIYSAYFEKPECEEKSELNLAKLHHIFIIAFATSLDALAVGVSLISIKSSVFTALITIGLVNFFISISGLLLGKKFGEKIGESFNKKILTFGGLVLISIGLKILFEHLL